jgi:hypothetical protein
MPFVRTEEYFLIMVWSDFMRTLRFLSSVSAKELAIEEIRFKICRNVQKATLE